MQEKTRNAFGKALMYGVIQTALLPKEAFRVQRGTRTRLARGKRKNQYRCRDIEWDDQVPPMFSASNIEYASADKTPGLPAEG